MIDILEYEFEDNNKRIKESTNIVECSDVFVNESKYVISYIDGKGKLRYVADPKKNNGYYSSFFIKHAVKFKKRSSAELYRSKMTFGNPKIVEIERS